MRHCHHTQRGSGCLWLFLAAMVIGLADEYPYIVLPVAGVIAAAVAVAWIAVRRRS